MALRGEMLSRYHLHPSGLLLAVRVHGVHDDEGMTTMRLASRGWRVGCAAVVCALLSACGGGATGPLAPPPGAVAFIGQMRAAALSVPQATTTSSAAGSSQLVTADMTLDWAEYKFADLFPRSLGLRFPSIQYQGETYNARAYPGAWGVRYLGVTPDGRVFGLGDYTGQSLQAYETLSFWAGQVLADKCGVYPDLCGPAAPSAPGQARVAGQQCRGANQTGWCFQHPGEDADVVTDVAFVDATHGWLVSEKGRVLRTQDGGQTWQPLPAPAIASPRAQVYFTDRQVGWLVGGNVLFDRPLWRTVDGGQTWAPVSTQLTDVFALVVASPQLLVASGARLQLATSTTDFLSSISRDGGLSWQLTAQPVATVERNGVLWTFDLEARSTDAGRTFVYDTTFPWTGQRPSVDMSLDGWGLRFHQGWDGVVGRPLPPRVWGRRGHDAAWVEGVVPPAMSASGRSLSAHPMLFGPTGAWAAIQTTEDISTLWRSEDGLLTWRTVNLPRSAVPGLQADLPELDPAQFSFAAGFAIGFLDSDTAWVQTSSQEAAGRGWHITHDGGRTWSANRQPWHGQNNTIDEVRRDSGGGLLMKQAGGSRWWRSLDNGQAWTALPLEQPADGEESISQILFVSADRGLALSNKGTLLSTDDGGQRWRALGTETGLQPWVRRPSHGSYLDWPHQSGQLLRAQDGDLWMQREGKLAISSDEGRSWRVVGMDLRAHNALPASGLPGGIYPWEPRRILWADGQFLVVDLWHRCRHPENSGLPFSTAPVCDAAIAVSDDGGVSWQVRSPQWDEYTHVAFVSRNTGIRAFCGAVDLTEDGGRTWRAVVGDGAARRYDRITPADACERVPQRLLIVGRGADQEVWILFADRSYRSADGGRSWRTSEPPVGPIENVTPDILERRDISFFDLRTGWATTAGGDLASTRDGGRTWTLQPTGFSKRLTAVYAADRDSAWAGGPHNTILATRTGGR